MALSGQYLATFLDYLNSKEGLLASDAGCFVKCSNKPDQEGTYLYFDLARRVFIRSGKVVGRPFTTRDGKHLVDAKKKVPLSKFHRWYPSMGSERANNYHWYQR